MIAQRWSHTSTTSPPCSAPARTRPPQALVALMDGICIQVLLTGSAYGEAYAREMLGRVAG